MKIPKPRKRGNSYQIEIMIDGSRLSATRDTKKECEQWAADKILAFKAGQKVEKQSSITFRELFFLYYERIGKFSQSKKQIKEQLGSFDKKFGQLADYQIHSITPKDLTIWRNNRSLQVASGTVLKDISLFSSVFTFARKELFILDDNPWFQISKPPQPKSRLRRIAQDEIDSIIKAGDFSMNKQPSKTMHYVVLAFLFAIETAMRRGEILSLRDNVIFDNHVHIKASKNGTSRDVPLSPLAKELLSLLSDGRIPLTVDAFKKSWQRIKKRALVSDLHFHDTRHEAISRMVNDRKLPVEVLAKITGHKKIEVLINVYYNPTAEELTSLFGAPSNM